MSTSKMRVELLGRTSGAPNPQKGGITVQLNKIPSSEGGTPLACVMCYNIKSERRDKESVCAVVIVAYQYLRHASVVPLIT